MSDPATARAGAAASARLRRALAWLAPALLCAVALTQLFAVSQSPLSRWKGGGFGMYSGVDSVRSRWIRAVLVTPVGRLPLSFDRLVADRPGLAYAARNVRSLPDEARLGALGQGLLASGEFADCTPAGLRGVSGHYVELMSPGRLRRSGCRRLAVTGLVLEIWRYEYLPAERRLVGEKQVGVALDTGRRARGRPR